MSDTVPPPPAQPAVPPPPAADHARPGDLLPSWRATLAIGWLCVFFAYAAVWQASVQIGIATWWVGPRSDPAPTLVRAIPFFITIVGLLLVVYNVRRLSARTFWVATSTLVIALPDFSRSVGLAVLEVLISLSMMTIAAASLTGRYRPASSATGSTSTTLPPSPPTDSVGRA